MEKILIMASKNHNFLLNKYISDELETGIEYKIESIDEAKKHVVEIRFEYGIKTKNDNQLIYIAHGFRNAIDTLEDTKELIEVLQEAVDFVEKLNEYFDNNSEE